LLDFKLLLDPIDFIKIVEGTFNHCSKKKFTDCLKQPKEDCFYSKKIKLNSDQMLHLQELVENQEDIEGTNKNYFKGPVLQSNILMLFFL
jgi:hypothetical protein